MLKRFVTTVVRNRIFHRIISNLGDILNVLVPINKMMINHFTFTDRHAEMNV